MLITFETTFVKEEVINDMKNKIKKIKNYEAIKSENEKLKKTLILIKMMVERS